MLPRRKSTVAPPPSECPLMECMNLLAGAWTVNVVWYLRDGSRRFGELRYDLSGISAKTLTARLRRLETDGLVSRTVKPTSPPSVEYDLTAFGRRLLPAIEAIAEVGMDLKRVRASGEVHAPVETASS